MVASKSASTNDIVHVKEVPERIRFSRLVLTHRSRELPIF